LVLKRLGEFRERTNHLLPVAEECYDGKEEELHYGATGNAYPKPFSFHLQNKAEQECRWDPNEIERAQVDIGAQVLPPASSSNT